MFLECCFIEFTPFNILQRERSIIHGKGSFFPNPNLKYLIHALLAHSKTCSIPQQETHFLAGQYFPAVGSKPSSTDALFLLQKCLASSLLTPSSLEISRMHQRILPSSSPPLSSSQSPFSLLSSHLPIPPPLPNLQRFFQRPQYCFEFSCRGVGCCG